MSRTSASTRPRMDAVAFLRRSAQAWPNRVAVAHHEGEVTYRDLLARTDHLAGMLPRVEDGPEAIVVVTEHDAATPEMYFGVMAAGHAVVPVSARLPDQAIARVAASAGSRLGLVAPSLAHRVGGLAESSEAIRWVPYPAATLSGPLPERVSVVPAGTAMVPFTSWTTGRPKGVVVTHANLIANGFTAALVFGVGAVNCQVNPLPLAHFAGASRVVLAAVNAGTHVILPEFDPHLVFASIDQWQGTHLTVAPSMVADLLKEGPEHFDLRSLETLIYGTAPMPMQVASELVDRMQCELINGYGLTESTGLVTALDGTGHRRAVARGDLELLSSVGRTVPGVELRILDADHNDVSEGAAGEIALRGMKVSPGYLFDPEETGAKFLPDGWLLSGDQGRLTSENTVILMGRIDEMIITGGVNVQPLEIENEAMHYQGIAACAAFAVPSSEWGQELRLAVVAAPGAIIEPGEVRAFLRDRLDRYKVPKAVHVLSELPRSAVGKVQRRTLAEQHASLGNDEASAG